MSGSNNASTHILFSLVRVDTYSKIRYLSFKSVREIFISYGSLNKVGSNPNTFQMFPTRIFFIMMTENYHKISENDLIV